MGAWREDAAPGFLIGLLQIQVGMEAHSYRQGTGFTPSRVIRVEIITNDYFWDNLTTFFSTRIPSFRG